MSLISVLRAILNFVFFFSVIGALTAPVIAWMAVTEDIYSHFNYIEKDSLNSSLYTVLVMLMVLGYFLFVAMIYYLKQAAYTINHRQMTSEKLRLSLHRAGWLCIAGTALFKLPQLLVSFIIRPINHQSSSLSSGVELTLLPDSFLVLVAFGLFLVIQARMIARHLELQDELKYTI